MAELGEQAINSAAAIGTSVENYSERATAMQLAGQRQYRECGR